MKYCTLLILAFTGIIIVSGCIQQITPSSETVKVNLTIDEWTSWISPEEAHKIKSSILAVKEGEEFGSTDFVTAPQNKPFKLELCRVA